jgi:hypothetical protein
MKSVTRSILILTVLAATLPAQTLEVIAAYYGADRNFVDVTSIVRAQAETAGLALTVGADALGGDPFPGQLKSLRIYYKLGTQFQQGEWKDSEAVAIGRTSPMRGGLRGRVDRSRTATGQLTILRAIYGAGNRTVDVTNLVQGRVQNNVLEFDVTGTQLGDPAPGTLKELVVTYQYAGLTREARAGDGQRLRLPVDTIAPQTATQPAPTATAGLRIVSALYAAGSRVMDVTSLISSRVAADRLSVPVDNNTMGGDPQRGAAKVLTIVYEWNGQRFTDSAKEGQTMRLPSDRALAASPAVSLPTNGVCFYPSTNYQGTPVCAVLGQDQPRVNTVFGSLRLLGTVRQVELFESPNYTGRSVRVTSDLADLSQASGGFFGTPATWAPNLASFRMSQ